MRPVDVDSREDEDVAREEISSVGIPELTGGEHVVDLPIAGAA
jgi:hypothetical protein